MNAQCVDLDARFESEDGIVGTVEPMNAFVGKGETQTISVRLNSIPQRPAGTALKFSVVASAIKI